MPGEATLRKARVGDLGWTFMRQAELYASEFGYLPVFETYVAEGLPPFLRGFDGRRDALWIAEAEGRRVGSVAVTHDEGTRAKLRWFFLEPEWRGRGVGRRLLHVALEFARGAGYGSIHLWTVSDLVDARRAYEAAGFALLREDAAPCPWAPWAHEQEWGRPLQ